ncbi:MAG: DUF1566 domain-containing protein [Gammaproteobacteria bacterium]|jgi:hypothetical protein
MKRICQLWILLHFIGGPGLDGSNAFAEQLCHDALAATAPDHYYRSEKAGTVIDVRHHLMWQRCSLGQQWQDEQCTGEIQSLSFNEAIDEAQHDNTADYEDWRLPTIHELSTLSELRCYQPAINLAYFPNTPAGNFWTSTVFANNSAMAWLVHFQYAENHTAKQTFKAAVRLVRDVAR